MSDLDGLQPGEVVEFRICRWSEEWRRATVVSISPFSRMVTIRSDITGYEYDHLRCELRRVPRPVEQEVKC